MNSSIGTGLNHRTASSLLFLGCCLFFASCILQAQIDTAKEEGEIRIGLLLEESASKTARSAAERAVSEINEGGGLQGRNLQLLIRSMEGPWGQGSKQAVDLIFEEGVWALIGANRGRNAHLVEQVVAKTSTVFLSALAADPTLSKAYVPHFFNLVPNSEQQAETILDDLVNRRGLSKWILISDLSYDSQKAVEGFKSRESYDSSPPLAELLCESSGNFEAISQKVRQTGAQALVILSESKVSWQLIRYLRSHHLDIPIYGHLQMLTGEAEEPGSGSSFMEVYLVGNGSGLAQNQGAYVYDAVRLLAAAIEEAGFDPNRLQKAVSETVYRGATGTIQFDAHGNRLGLPDLIGTEGKILSPRKP